MKFDFKAVKEKTKEAFRDMGRGAKVVGRKCADIYHSCPFEVVTGSIGLLCGTAAVSYAKGIVDGYDVGESHTAQIIGESMAHAAVKAAELEGTETEEVSSEK